MSDLPAIRPLDSQPVDWDAIDALGNTCASQAQWDAHVPGQHGTRMRQLRQACLEAIPARHEVERMEEERADLVLDLEEVELELSRWLLKPRTRKRLEIKARRIRRNIRRTDGGLANKRRRLDMALATLADGVPTVEEWEADDARAMALDYKGQLFLSFIERWFGLGRGPMGVSVQSGLIPQDWFVATADRVVGDELQKLGEIKTSRRRRIAASLYRVAGLLGDGEAE